MVWKSSHMLCKPGMTEATCAVIRNRLEHAGHDDAGYEAPIVSEGDVSEEAAEVLRCPVSSTGDQDEVTVDAMAAVLRRVRKDLGPGAERLSRKVMDALGPKRGHHLLVTSLGSKFSYLERAAGMGVGDEFHAMLAAMMLSIGCNIHRVKVDVAEHVCKDAFCACSPGDFVRLMKMAIDRVCSEGDADERGKWWSLVGVCVLNSSTRLKLTRSYNNHHAAIPSRIVGWQTPTRHRLRPPRLP